MKSLYQILLGESFNRLPAAVGELHSHTRSATYTGRGSVERSPGWLSGFVGTLMRFPPAMPDTPVTVHFDICDGVETWRREFGEHLFQSTLSAQGEQLLESFGWVTIRFTLKADATGLKMFPVCWTALGVPLPKLIWPSVIANESSDGERFQFYVDAAMPVIGPVVRYRGYLEKAAK